MNLLDQTFWAMLKRFILTIVVALLLVTVVSFIDSYLNEREIQSANPMGSNI